MDFRMPSPRHLQWRSYSRLTAESSPATVVATCALLFALIFVARVLDGVWVHGIHLFFVIPVIILALRFGMVGGAIGAFVAMALMAVWVAIRTEEDLVAAPSAALVSPSLTILAAGLIVGYLSRSLLYSEKRFRIAAENNLEAFALYSAVRDASGRITDFRNEFINEAGASSVGMRPEEMAGKLVSELFPGRLESRLMGIYSRVIETGEPYFEEAVDYINVLGDETLVRAFDVRVTKLNGGVQVTWRDITDNVRLRKENEYLATIVESSPEAVMSVDTSGIVRAWSKGAAEIYGYEADEVLGRSFKMFIVDAEMEGRSEVFRRIVSGEKVTGIVSTDLRKDGSEFRTESVFWPIYQDGEVIGGARRVVGRDGSSGADQLRSTSSSQLVRSGRTAGSAGVNHLQE